MSKSDDLSGSGSIDPYTVDRHFGDIGPIYADPRPNAADLMARGAAERMWKKVEDDLDQIDRAEIEEADDD